MKMSPRTVITIVAVLGLMLPTVFYVWSGINAGIEEEQLKSVVRKASDKSIEKACALTDLADFYLLRNSYERATQEYRNALIIEDALPEKKPAISFMTLTGLAVCLAIERHEESGWFKEDSEVPALVKRATLIADAAGCAQLNGPLPGVACARLRTSKIIWSIRALILSYRQDVVQDLFRLGAPSLF